MYENDRIQIQISLELVPKSPIDKKPALVQAMAWRRTGDKPLPEPMMTQFTDTYMQHYGGILMSSPDKNMVKYDMIWHDIKCHYMN